MDRYSVSTPKVVPNGMFTGFNTITLSILKKDACKCCSTTLIGCSSENEFITKYELVGMLNKLVREILESEL
jgi:hypothetical protein